MTLSDQLISLPTEADALRALVEHAPVAMAIMDRELRYIAASRMWRAYTTKPDESIIGKQHFEVFDLPERWHRIYERCLAGAIESSDHDSLVMPGGETIHFKWEVRPWRDASGEIAGTLVWSEVITERVLAQEGARHSASLLRTFFDSAPFMMGVLQMEGEELRIVQANTSFAAAVGSTSAESMEGRRTVSELKLSLRNRDIWMQHMRGSQAAGPVHFEYDRGPEYGHQVFAVSVCPVPSHSPQFPQFCFLIRDVTEAQRNARALAASEERLAFALDATQEGVWDWDLATDRVLASSRVAQQMGISPRDLKRSFSEWLGFVHPDDRDAVATAIGDHIAGLTDAFDAEYRLRHNDGRYIWFHCTSKVVQRDAAGKATRMVGAQADITRRKTAEEELRRAKEEALAASQAKSAFLANISHEIRTPMTAILGYADILRESDLSPEKRSEFIDVIHRSGQQLLTLLNDLLDLAKVEAGKMECVLVPCDVKPIVREVAALFGARAAGKRVAFSVDLPEMLSDITTDPTRLRQILTNLVDNAIKFTLPGGTVKLRVSSGTRPDAVGLPVLQFDLTDTGIGMTAPQMNRLFEPFAQADSSTTREFGGTGLGLAISRHFARMLGGNLAAESTTGKGSRFTLWLPLAAGTMRFSFAAVKPAVVAPREAPLTARVLLVEDGEDNQLLFHHVLAKAGAAVECAIDGAQAIAMAMEAQRQNRPYDLILMDVQMPGLDGNEAARRLRANGIAAPIVALSAAAMEHNRRESLEAGCNDFLSKPVNLAQLVATVRCWTAK